MRLIWKVRRLEGSDSLARLVPSCSDSLCDTFRSPRRCSGAMAPTPDPDREQAIADNAAGPKRSQGETQVWSSSAALRVFDRVLILAERRQLSVRLQSQAACKNADSGTHLELRDASPAKNRPHGVVRAVGRIQAERGGFEPPIRETRIRHFQCRSFSHSDTSPEARAADRSAGRKAEG